jgi:uncharacterized protein YecA (UPF0149 family)
MMDLITPSTRCIGELEDATYDVTPFETEFPEAGAALRELVAARIGAIAFVSDGIAVRRRGMQNFVLFRDVETPKNAPCPCNSGKKFKLCCGVTDQK